MGLRLLQQLAGAEVEGLQPMRATHWRAQVRLRVEEVEVEARQKGCQPLEVGVEAKEHQLQLVQGRQHCCQPQREMVSHLARTLAAAAWLEARLEDPLACRLQGKTGVGMRPQGRQPTSSARMKKSKNGSHKNSSHMNV